MSVTDQTDHQTISTIQIGAVVALETLERMCQRYEASFPDAVREIFETMAARRGSTAALVATRPGCWEATHITALAEAFDLNATGTGGTRVPAEPATRETVTNAEMDDPTFRGALGPWTGITWHLPHHEHHDAQDFTECRAHIEDGGGGWDGCNGCEREPGATGIADHEPLVVVVGTVLYGQVDCGWDADTFHAGAQAGPALLDGDRMVAAARQLGGPWIGRRGETP